MKSVVVTGSFDNLGSKHVRFLHEASRQGDVHVLLWSDKTATVVEGRAPTFPEKERLYLLQAIRYVSEVSLVKGRFATNALPQMGSAQPGIWIVDEASDTPQKRDYARCHGLDYRVLAREDLRDFPVPQFDPIGNRPTRTRVIVTGCFDWFHSGHVRFFEEVSELGDLYVVVGNDANIRLLKGQGHPMFSQDERRYMVASVRYVKQALISNGQGWMDAEPEICVIKPDIYAVNEDGDKPEKRAFCESHGIQYLVLKRVPKEGLPRRESTNLRHT